MHVWSINYRKTIKDTYHTDKVKEVESFSHIVAGDIFEAVDVTKRLAQKESEGEWEILGVTILGKLKQNPSLSSEKS